MRGRPLSAVAQHQNYYLSKNILEHPFDWFWTKLTDQLQQWKEAGEQLVIGGNWNRDITDPQILQLRNRLNLKVPHNELHQTSPCTRYPGQHTIDFFLQQQASQLPKAGILDQEEVLARITVDNG